MENQPITTTDAASPPAIKGAELSPNEKNWATAAHLASVVGWVGVPFGNFLAPLVILLMKKDDSEFVRSQAVESLNFQISMTFYIFVSGIIAMTIIGLVVAIPAILAIVLGDIIFTILGAVSVSNGEGYRYPLTIRLVN